MNGHRSRNVSNWDLVRLELHVNLGGNETRQETNHFLDFNFLERTKTTSSGLHVQGAFNVVLPAVVRIRAIDERCELLICDFLENLRAAIIAGISVDEEERLDFGDAGDDSPHSYKLAQVGSFDITYSHGNVR